MSARARFVIDTNVVVSAMLFHMGNHDAWFAGGLPQPQPAWMSNGEVQQDIQDACRMVIPCSRLVPIRPILFILSSW